MQTQPHTQATFTMPVKPHRLIASDRVEQTPVRRSDGDQGRHYRAADDR